MDSREETKKHINNVATLLREFSLALKERAENHDKSKLETPEVEVFDVVTPKLKGLTYGSPEYKKSLEDMGPALEHHYSNNKHHPEYWKNGIEDMTLVDIVEMLCDWQAATLRHDTGDIVKSINHNAQRFNISEQLKKILLNSCSGN